VKNNPVRYKDPTGHAAGKDHCSVTIEEGNKFFEKERAEIIAKANINTDKLTTGFMPIVGEPGRHFNANKRGRDSRIGFAEEHLNRAIKYQLSADEYKKSMEDNSNMSKKDKIRIKNIIKSLETAASIELGYGVHSIQDMYSHTKEFQKTVDLKIKNVKMHESTDMNDVKKYVKNNIPFLYDKVISSNPNLLRVDNRSDEDIMKDRRYQADILDAERKRNMSISTAIYFAMFKEGVQNGSYAKGPISKYKIDENYLPKPK